MQNVLGLDHVIILVRDLDDAERRMVRLGFRPTPRGTHSPEMGTTNATIVLRNGTYFETLAVLGPTPANEPLRDALAEREGAHGLVMKTADAHTAAAEFEAAGIALGGALEFTRPVEMPGGTVDAAFTVARTQPRATPGVWLFACQHHTPEVVWREDYLEHPNGARGITEVIGVADDLDAVARSYGVLFAERLRPVADRVTIAAGSATVTFLTPAAFTERFGAIGDEARGTMPRLAALRIEVERLEAAREILSREDVRFEKGADRTLLVPSGEACGTVLEFAP